MTRIKICGLKCLRDIEHANAARPDYVGFVFADSRRTVSPALARQMRSDLDPAIVPVGVFVDEDPRRIVAIAEEGTIEMVQLHGSEDDAYIGDLRSRTKLPLVKAIGMGKRDGKRLSVDAPVDYLLFDGSKAGSGTGFDWHAIPPVSRPFFLAGGLDPSNLARAIETVRPFAVDLSSGVETEGAKDRRLMVEAVRIAHRS
jgi:phosphoribosylanthranilate isomerase